MYELIHFDAFYNDSANFHGCKLTVYDIPFCLSFSFNCRDYKKNTM